MSKIYVIVDKYGFIAAYDNLKKAEKIIDDWHKQVDLIMIEFLLDEDQQREEIYFLPYKCHDLSDNLPVALVTNDRMKFLRTQVKLLNMELTFPDDIGFFTKKVNEIDAPEYTRLTEKKLRYKEEFVDTILTKLNENEAADTKLPFDKLMSGLIMDEYFILDDQYGYVVDKKTKEADELPSHENADDL